MYVSDYTIYVCVLRIFYIIFILLYLLYLYFILLFYFIFVYIIFAEREVWYEAATRAIEARIRAAASSSVSGTTPPPGVARGVVLFVGDGMGMSTLTAARILSGQRRGNPGEETQLAWDNFPAVALARVSTNGNVQIFFSLFPRRRETRSIKLAFHAHQIHSKFESGRKSVRFAHVRSTFYGYAKFANKLTCVIRITKKKLAFCKIS